MGLLAGRAGFLWPVLLVAAVALWDAGSAQDGLPAGRGIPSVAVG